MARLLKFAVVKNDPDGLRVVSKHREYVAADEACRKLRRRSDEPSRYAVFTIMGDGNLGVLCEFPMRQGLHW